MNDSFDYRRLAKLVLFVASFVAIVCFMYPRDSIRYKITVNIETPEGLKTSSAVREVTVQQTPKLTPEMQSTKIFKGEAVVLDLGTRGVLFAVMGTDDYRTFFRALAPNDTARSKATSAYGLKPYKALPKEAKPLSVQFHPTMVMFKDMKDPKSITLAYHVTSYEVRDKNDNKEIKYKVEDNLEKLFGKGVKLQSITMERTEEPLTERIGSYLGWIPQLNGRYLNGRNINGPKLYDQFHTGHFKAGR